MPPTPQTTDFATAAARLLLHERRVLCRQWLARLGGGGSAAPAEEFPADELLDHVPQLIAGIGEYVGAPTDVEFSAVSRVSEKARELGALRHTQDASVHQIMREFDLLATVLEDRVFVEANAWDTPAAAAIARVVSRIGYAVRNLMQTTADTFGEMYSDTIERQQARLMNFNRMVSHELRVPLNTLEISMDLLIHEDLSVERRARLLAMAHKNVEQTTHLLHRLDELMEASEQREGAPSRQAVDISALGRDVAARLEQMAEARGVELRVAEGLPVLEADGARLEMVFLNLLANGIKYSDSTKKQCFVEVDAAPMQGAADQVAIAVRDNGIGLPDEMKEAVFARFYRGHTQLDEVMDVTGDGLGLAIVEECVGVLGGNITLDSEEGVGTTFLLMLPTSPASASNLSAYG